MVPKVSVIMGIYNCEKTLPAAIDSIVSQTYSNWELIMCDDGSTDSTYEVAHKYFKKYPKKIKLIKNKENLKLAATLNHCLKYANGDYIARMDGDDISAAERLEKQVDFLNNHQEYDLVGTQMISFDETGDIGLRHVFEQPNKYVLRYNTPFCHATIMCRKKVYDTLNGYRVSKEIRRCEDVDLWFRFYDAGFNGYNLQVPLYKVRETADDFKRRTFSHGIDAFVVCLKGYKLLNYPKRYYIFLLKPLICSAVPGFLMKWIHNTKDKQS